MIQLRPYQREAVSAIFDYWRNGGGNPLVDLATGLGKSVIIAKLTQDTLAQYRDMRVLILVHVRELVDQDFRAMLRLWPDAPVGINSAGLGRRDRHSKILFASIQSVFREPEALGRRDLVIIDESHLVPKSGEGMYRRLLEALREAAPDVRVAGFTATPFRLGEGRLDEGGERLFDKIVYSYGIGPGIADGWLSPLISKASATEIDVSSVAKRGGEFVAGALESAADRSDVTAAACQEIVRYGGDRRSWLLFCSGVRHAHHVRDELVRLGITAETITGQTLPHIRKKMIADFHAGRIRALTNAQVLTTGFDSPETDLIVFLRPTLSTGLYLQMVGRGVRKADGKPNCLVLDFAGNVRRHGPVDAAIPAGRSAKADDDSDEVKVAVDTVRAKPCPNCENLVALAAATCPHCGHQWPVTAKHEAQADDTPILSTERPAAPELVPVVSWEAKRWQKPGSPDSVRITYYAGLQSYSEWICPEHTGFAKEKAKRWWQKYAPSEPPEDTVEGMLAAFPELAMPSHILVRPSANGKWMEIVGRQFAKHEVAA